MRRSTGGGSTPGTERLSLHGQNQRFLSGNFATEGTRPQRKAKVFRPFFIILRVLGDLCGKKGFTLHPVRNVDVRR
jgi:hypothetical protein